LISRQLAQNGLAPVVPRLGVARRGLVRANGGCYRQKGLPKGGRGYKEATAEIERRINVLFDWLAEVHAEGRPAGLVPPL